MNWIAIDELRNINDFYNKSENLRWYGRENISKFNIWNSGYFIYKGKKVINDRNIILYETKDLQSK